MSPQKSMKRTAPPFSSTCAVRRRRKEGRRWLTDGALSGWTVLSNVDGVTCRWTERARDAADPTLQPTVGISAEDLTFSAASSMSLMTFSGDAREALSFHARPRIVELTDWAIVPGGRASAP